MLIDYGICKYTDLILKTSYFDTSDVYFNFFSANQQTAFGG